MQLTALVAAALAAAPALALPQSQGGFIYAVEKFYTAGGCTGTVSAYPVFGGSNLCQPLPANTNAVSANTTSVEQGCTVHLFTDTQCTQGETLAPPNHCEQASTPFKAINVECP